MEQKIEIPAEHVISAQDETITTLQRRVVVLSALVRQLSSELESARKAAAEKAEEKAGEASDDSAPEQE